MSKTLLEAYAPNINVANSVYQRTHDGSKMSYNNKVATAVVLNNVNRILSEAFENSVGTQRADMGSYKKFCMSVTNVVFPSLIAEDLVIVKPMTSHSGVVTYAKYTYGSNKGGITQGQLIADPWSIAPRNEDNMRYTGAPVVETVSAGEVIPAWKPLDGSVTFIAEDGTETELTVSGGKVTAPADGRIRYLYDNVKIPQNDLPTINVEMANIPLVAKARRIAIYYSQIAAFQAKTDYGFDIGRDLAEKACAELSFQINEEIIHFLATLGRKTENYSDACKFNKTVPLGLTKRDHYADFAENIATAKNIVYQRTQKFMPSYMLAAPDVLVILQFLPGFKAASLTNVAGPFMAGTIDGMKVFISPTLDTGEWFLGINGNDLATSVAVYAPYMPIVPTQLLGYSDGAMSQGFSTMYDLKPLNEQLIVGSKIVEEPITVIVNDPSTPETPDSDGEDGENGNP
ncbi:MAG TPA: hypothetical protein GX745_08130 [Clostridiales bacterium]|nr:hypothetical protein [Clostridiales bacterium]